ncbi:MAG: hypothetical protein IT372_01530 [Polyangiaceae bacterium]|nr:hypothetical protein [Polyangiaceae bacterium]
MRWPKLLAHFSLSFTEPDDSGVASIREGLLGRLHAAGWSPAGARGDESATAWRPAAHGGDEHDEALLEARVDAHQDVLEGWAPGRRC